MRVSLHFVYNIDVGVFLRHWWKLNSQSNHIWSLGITNGISKPDFYRLLCIAIYVVFLYFPLSLFMFILQLQLPLSIYSWERIHGPQWAIIVKEEYPTVIWGMWIGPLTAITLFSVLGTTRNAIEFYKKCGKSIGDCIFAIFQPCRQQRNCRAPPRLGNSTVEHECNSESFEVIALGVGQKSHQFV